jgi:UDP-glucose:(glucosyl)LPS alpha-1,2-glucosyltransferase
MNDNQDLVELAEVSKNSNGGSELMLRGLYARMDRELLKKFQIIMSRIPEKGLDPSRVRIFWCEDLPGDPASEHLKNGGWNKFHKIVFASNWQMTAYINYYKIPWSKCLVLLNAIEPVDTTNVIKDNDAIELAYWSTPHRGLHILLPVFQKLCEKYNTLNLHVMSSFNLYGWGQRDEQYKELFEAIKNTPRATYYGSLDNNDLRSKIAQFDILAYPSIWMETSCITLMEAMSAKMLAVCPNFGALPETAANFANMYQWDEDVNRHASLFYSVLDVSIQSVRSEQIQKRLALQKIYADIFYSWPKRIMEWKALLTSLQNEPTKVEEPKAFFEYKVG